MMTREEVINALKEIKDRAWGWHINEQVLGIDYDKFIEIMDAVLSFLNPVSREQVEKVWRGEWIGMTDDDGCTWYECSQCEHDLDSLEVPNHFCPACGAPMTDEAVEMVMERLEAMKDETD